MLLAPLVAIHATVRMPRSVRHSQEKSCEARRLHHSLHLVVSFCFVASCLPSFFFVLLDVAIRMWVAYCLLQDTSCCIARCVLLHVGCLLLCVEPLLIVARILLVDSCWLPCCTLLLVACCFLFLLVVRFCLLLLVVACCSPALSNSACVCNFEALHS